MNTITQQYITDAKGKKTAVVIPIEEYKNLLEDLHDLSQIATRKNEPVIDLAQAEKLLAKK